DRDAELVLEDLRERRQREVRARDFLAEPRRQERALETERPAVDQAQPLHREQARAAPEAERPRLAPRAADELAAEQARGDVLALRGEIAREPPELEDVVVDRRRGDERPEAVS